VKWGWINSSPTDRVTPPKVVRTDMHVPTPAQLLSLVKAAEATNPVLATAIFLAALTGARRGEIAALRWSDIDLVKGRVRIARSLTVSQGEQHVGPTKSRQSRDIALDAFCIENLKQRSDAMADQSERAESPLVADPYVLSYNADGALPVNPDTLSHGFTKLCAAMERPALKKLRQTQPRATRGDLVARQQWPFRFHDLRHFSVTTLIGAGVDVRTVADRHGHARATMTLDRYAHALPERDRAAAEILGEVFLSAGKSPNEGQK
jgi:integrase